MSELYKRLAELCESRGITGYRMCKECKLSTSTMTDLKSGRKKTLNAESASRVAEYFGVSVPYLYGQETKKDQPGEGLVNDDPELTEYLQELQQRPEMKMLFHTFKSATKEQIEAIVTAWEARNNIKGE